MASGTSILLFAIYPKQPAPQGWFDPVVRRTKHVLTDSPVCFQQLCLRCLGLFLDCMCQVKQRSQELELR